MYLINNAIKNIGRNKGRNLILGGMMTLILFFATLSVMIYSAANHQIKVFKDQLSASIILYRDDEKLTRLEDYREPKLEDYKKFATSSLLKSTEMILSSPASLPEGKAIDEDGKVVGIEREDSEEPTVKGSTNMIFGTNRPTINGEFESGIRKITEGKVFEKNNEVVVSQSLAETNGWKVNDMIKIQLSSIGEKESDTIQVLITGIYEDHAIAYEDEEIKMALVHRGNEIFTSFETLANAQGSFISVTANFTIQDPSLLEDLEAELHAMGLPEYFGLQTDSSAYQKVIAPLMGLRDMSLIFMVSVVIVGGSILILLSVLSIRERIYEVGILRAMGMKKNKLALSFFLEGLIITLICLCFSFSCAKLVSEPIATALFQQQETTESFQNIQNNNVAFSSIGGFSAGAGTQVDRIQITMTWEMMAQTIVLAVLFGTITSIGGIYYVVRFEPRKILSDRN